MNIKFNIPIRSASICAVRQLTPAVLCCGALVLLAGCASEPESHLVSAPPPSASASSVTTTTTTAPVAVAVPADGNPANMTIATTTPVVSTTIVTEAPPALQSEVVLAQP